MALINQKAWIKKRPKQIKDITYMMYQYNGGGYTSNYYSVNIDSITLANSLGYRSVVEFNNSEDEYGKSLNELFFTYLPTPFPVWLDPLPFEAGYQNPRTFTQADMSLYTLYGERKLDNKMFPYLAEWEGTTEDYQYIYNQIKFNICNCIRQNYYKWKNLLKSCVLEFNPLWNVDGTEETTRTLEQDGTIQNQKRGSDAIAHDESNQYKKTGTITDKKTGTETNLKSGTESTDVTNETVEQNSGTDTETLSKTTTESSTWYDSEKSAKVNGLQIATSSENDSITTHNVTDRLTHDVTDLTTNNTTDTDTKDIDITTTYNNNDTMTRDLLDTERILLERHGNIGVTTTTKLLTEFREYVNFNLLRLIVHDIANYISEGVY